ncbi:hypothetical protein [Mesorhizobium sp. LNHC209A00]|uniref:hypothetical protein n=1 Tax=Mesorhizobium TaxID=68287 RepID=UPI0003CFA167|nr:hypothetical protein [Mesorhizobium sp. LNHC209A00]ESZ01879.1 hypothetical protein X738_01785 [Mesorhizobium sp. LNHC209A00]
MKFKSEHDNPLPDLVELKTKVSPKEGDDHAHDLLVELRVHPFEIEEAIGTIAVEISEAVLSVQFTGLAVVPRTKLGNPVMATKVRQDVQRERSVTQTEDTEKTRSASASGGGASLTGINGKVEGSRSSAEKSGQSVNEKTTSTEVIERYQVKAIGNDNWKITGAPLDGVYIDHEPLCEVTPVAGKNRLGVEAELVVKQKHVKAELTASTGWFSSIQSVNQKKIAKVLIAKSLHAAGSDQPFDGKFVFGKSQSFDEG